MSTDFHIPLFHRVYAGHVHDSVEFRSITAELAAHYRDLVRSCDHITLIFDTGNNSAAAFQTLTETPFHFVGSLVLPNIGICWPFPAAGSALSPGHG